MCRLELRQNQFQEISDKIKKYWQNPHILTFAFCTQNTEEREKRRYLGPGPKRLELLCWTFNLFTANIDLRPPPLSLKLKLPLRRSIKYVLISCSSVGGRQSQLMGFDIFSLFQLSPACFCAILSFSFSPHSGFSSWFDKLLFIYLFIQWSLQQSTLELNSISLAYLFPLPPSFHPCVVSSSSSSLLRQMKKTLEKAQR